MTYDDVVTLATRMPGVRAVIGRRARAIKVGGRLLARVRNDDTTLVLRLPIVVRDHLCAAEPAKFHLEQTYRDFPYVLVRLPAVNADDLTPLLEEAWRLARGNRA